MVMESKYQSRSSNVITISQGELQRILRCIEADFLQSKAYLQSLTELDNSVSKSVGNFSSMLSSLGREAIRLTFRELAKHCNLVAVSVEEKAENLVTHSPSPSHHYYSRGESMSLDSQNFAAPISSKGVEEKNIHSLSTEFINSSYYNSSQSSTVEPQTSKSDSPNSQSYNSLVLAPVVNSSQPMKTKKKSKLELANQLAYQEREKGLQEIGAILCQARVQKSWSIDYLHNLTFIPVYQIAALESGDVKILPEDVYLQGFIRRLAEALNLEVSSLLQKLPATIHSSLPSWHQEVQSSQSYIQPVHLYLGYSALLAGALGGLAVIAPQEIKQLIPDLPTASPSSHSYNSQDNSPTQKSETNNKIIEAHRSIAPPESTF